MGLLLRSLVVAALLARCAAQRPGVVFGHEDPALNLLTNWDFEQPVGVGDDSWQTAGCTLEESGDALTGDKSLYVKKRSSHKSAVYGTVTGVKADTSYYFSAFIKILRNSKWSTYTTISLRVSVDGGGEKTIAELPYQFTTSEWKHIGGDYRVPAKGASSLKFRIQVQGRDVPYLLDTMAVTEIEKFGDWRADLAAITQQTRMSNVQISASLPSRTSASDVTISFDQVKPDFNWGLAIRASVYNDKKNDKYRAFMRDHFDWVTFEDDLTWNIMEPNKQGKTSTKALDKVVKDLKKTDLAMFGSRLVSENTEEIPAWAQGLAGSSLAAAVTSRVSGTLDKYGSTMNMWAVCTDYLHGHFLEESAEDQDLLSQQFRQANEYDGDMQLFLNDYDIVNSGYLTSAQATLARQLLAEGVPVHGVGVQSHLTDPVPPEVLAKRVQVAASAGLPVVMTELTVHAPNAEQRAEALEQALRVYYSNPGVAAVIVHGHNDQEGYSLGGDMVLTEGSDMTPNAAGQRLLQLMEEEFVTSRTWALDDAAGDQAFPAYHGTYTLTARVGSSTVYEGTHTVRPGQDLSLQLPLDGGQAEEESLPVIGVDDDTMSSMPGGPAPAVDAGDVDDSPADAVAVATAPSGGEDCDE